MRVAVVLVILTACGRFGFDAESSSDAAADDAAVIDAAPDAAVTIKAIASSGAFTAPSELRRALAVTEDRRVLTIATWYRSPNLAQMLFCAGIAANQQSFLWAATTDGKIGLEHQQAGIGYAAYPAQAWTHLDQWVHLVIAIDTNQVDPAMRVRLWQDGVEVATSPLNGMVFAQNLDLHFGTAGTVHTFGNKFTGNFDWSGSLAETYLVWGHALDASYFVTQTAMGLRSIVYTGPVTPESVYFDTRCPGTTASPVSPTGSRPRSRRRRPTCRTNPSTSSSRTGRASRRALPRRARWRARGAALPVALYSFFGISTLNWIT